MDTIYSVDRIEGAYAVLVDSSGNACDVKLEDLPDIKAGDMLEYENGKYIYCEELTKQRKEKLAKRTKRMFE